MIAAQLISPTNDEPSENMQEKASDQVEEKDIKIVNIKHNSPL